MLPLDGAGEAHISLYTVVSKYQPRQLIYSISLIFSEWFKSLKDFTHIVKYV